MWPSLASTAAVEAVVESSRIQSLGGCVVQPRVAATLAAAASSLSPDEGKLGRSLAFAYWSLPERAAMATRLSVAHGEGDV